MVSYAYHGSNLQYQCRFMESMMGVKERFDIPESYRLSKGAAWWRIIKMVNILLRVSFFHRKFTAL